MTEARRRWQAVELERRFSGPDRSLPGWFFAVTPEFKERLEIQWKKVGDIQTWAEPDRPAYSFDTGDILYDYSGARRPGHGWDEAAKHIHWAVQVKTASPSTMSVDQTSVTDGSVVFVLHRYSGGRPSQSWTSPSVPQAAFVGLLHTGTLPGHCDLPSGSTPFSRK